MFVLVFMLPVGRPRFDGAGLGPAINILAIVLTASVLGAELGIVRAVGAILGTRKMLVVVGLVVATSTACGFDYGAVF